MLGGSSDADFSRARSDTRLDRPARSAESPADLDIRAPPAALGAAQPSTVALRDRGWRKHLRVDMHAAVTRPAVDVADENRPPRATSQNHTLRVSHIKNL